MQFTWDWERVDGHERTDASLLVWSNLLRVVGEHGVAQREAHRLARVSRRALRTMPQFERWVVVESGEGRGRQRLRLTDEGERALDEGRALFDAVDADWRARFGDSAVDGVQTTLRAFVSGLDLELPHYPMPYGPADDRVTGGSSVAAKDGPPRIPAHGRDWPVVVRGDGDTVSDLPTSALLSQTPVAFAIDYEAAALPDWGMTTTAMLGLIPPDGVSVNVLPRTRAWPDALETRGLIVIEPDLKGRRRCVRLTHDGVKARRANETRLADIERAWEARYGARAVSRLRSALRAIEKGLDPSLLDWLLVLFTGGIGFRVEPQHSTVHDLNVSRF